MDQQNNSTKAKKGILSKRQIHLPRERISSFKSKKSSHNSNNVSNTEPHQEDITKLPTEHSDDDEEDFAEGADPRRNISCLGKVFFKQFNHFFNKKLEDDFDIRDLNPIPKGIKSKHLLREYREKETVYKETESKKDVNQDMKFVERFFNLSTKEVTYLKRGLWDMIKWPMIKSCFFRILERFFALYIPIVMGKFIKELTRDTIDYRRIAQYMATAVFFMFISNIFGEHSRFYTAQSTSKGG